MWAGPAHGHKIQSARPRSGRVRVKIFIIQGGSDPRGPALPGGQARQPKRVRGKNVQIPLKTAAGPKFLDETPPRRGETYDI